MLRRGGAHLAKAAKSGVRVGSRELRGLEVLEGLRNLVRWILLHRGERRLVTAVGIEVRLVELIHEERASRRL